MNDKEIMINADDELDGYNINETNENEMKERERR